MGLWYCAHLSRVEVLECLHDFMLLIHDKWSIVCHWLTQWFSWHNENSRIIERPELYIISWEGQVHYISRFEYCITHSDATLDHEDHHIVSITKRKFQRTPCIKSDIIKFYWGECFCYSGNTSKLTSNHSSDSSVKCYFWNTSSSQCLVTRCCHLVFTREVDPELYEVCESSCSWKLTGEKFVMEESGTCRHPLDFILSDDTTIACSILMFYFTRVYNCHRLKSSMWMKSYTWTITIFLWFKLSGEIIIEHEKWARLTRHLTIISWYILRHMKSISDPVFFSRVLDTSDSFLHIKNTKNISILITLFSKANYYL